MKQNENEVSPDLKLTKISPGQINGRNVINVNLQNPTMAYINTMNVKATIKGITDSDIAYYYSNPMMQMAPNTNFDLPMPTSNQSAATRVSEPLKAGKYRLQLIVNARTDSQENMKRRLIIRMNVINISGPLTKNLQFLIIKLKN